MTKLPKNFQFSQSSLKDYVECARRFELRYIDDLKWPAVETEPVLQREKLMQQGNDFHHRVHQHLLGIAEDVLTSPHDEAPLNAWWGNYLSVKERFLDKLPEERHPEIQLSAPLEGYRLVAKYDLIAIQPGERVVIVDWKTSLRRTPRPWLENSLQTVIYRYMLVQAGARLNGDEPILPEQIEMIYWFAEYPDQPEYFPYSAEQYKADDVYLRDLIHEVETREQFDLTTDTKRCQFCTYRSLCERGIQAGQTDEFESDESDDSLGFDFDFDFDQIAEIEF